MLTVGNIVSEINSCNRLMKSLSDMISVADGFVLNDGDVNDLDEIIEKLRNYILVLRDLPIEENASLECVLEKDDPSAIVCYFDSDFDEAV